VDELTNWYIRFNRKRHKGEDGPEDTVLALNTLFETLFTLCRTMASYTPFITESIYQGLRQYIPESKTEDTRSIHFLLFPEVKSEYFDEDIERQVQRLQTVIELTRNIRERHTISLKTPLMKLLVYHPDNQFHEDVKPLTRYIQSELNVREVVFTTDETVGNVQYRATADWPTLGKKLRKDLGKVKAGLSKLTSDQVREYEKTGRVVVEGFELVAGDLVVNRSADLPQGGFLATHTNNDVVVILDTQIHPELESEGLAREVINRVQKLRKKAKLKPVDDVNVFYRFEAGDGQSLADAIAKHNELISKTCRSEPMDVSKRRPGTVTIIEEEQEIFETKFMLTLAHP